MKRFEGQVGIVTGGLSGIGRALVDRLIEEGARVVVFDLVNKYANCPSSCSDAEVVFAVDVTDDFAVRTACDEVFNRFGRIDFLANCAGITGRTNVTSHEVTLEEFERVQRVNVHGPFLTSKHVLPVMLSSNYGRILHMASIAGKEGNAGMLAYSTSKAALIGITKVQGKEYAHTGITVNAIAPAVIETPMVAALPEAQVRYMTEKIPMKRCGSLEEVATMALFILSREVSFTTGFTFDLTGGRAVY